MNGARAFCYVAVGILLFALSAASWGASTRGMTATARALPSSGYVVSYLVSADGDEVEVPEDDFPGQPARAHRWQWRIFDPESGRDTLFLSLPSFPLRVRWDPDFRFVGYISGDRIERTAWRLGAEPQVIAHLPADSALCDFWESQPGRWHLISQRAVGAHRVGNYLDYQNSATRWDLGEDGTWSAAASDTFGDPDSGCIDSDSLARGVPIPARVMVDDLLDSMRIEHHAYSLLRKGKAGQDTRTDATVWVPSTPDTSVGLEVGEGSGDSDHAREPVIWVDRKNSWRRATVYARGDSHDATLGQIAFAERGRSLLIVAEYSGAYPAVADMRAGRVIFRVTRPSARGVWVPAPR